MRNLLLICFSICAINLSAQQFKPVANQSEFETELKKSSSTTSTITATFDQLKFLSFMEEEVLSSGVFYFSKPNKVRWEYMKPQKYFLIINESKITTVMNGKKNEIDASKNKTFSEINKIMLGSINGDIASNPSFTSNLLESSDQYELHLSPKSKSLKDLMTEIVIWFDKSNMSVNKIKMLEASGDFSLISLKNKKINDAIDPGIFTP